MEFVFALPESCSVAWGDGGVWLNPGDAFFADDPFVVAHQELFSHIPPRLRSTSGRELPLRVPLAMAVPASGTVTATTPAKRGRANG